MEEYTEELLELHQLEEEASFEEDYVESCDWVDC